MRNLSRPRSGPRFQTAGTALAAAAVCLLLPLQASRADTAYDEYYGYDNGSYLDENDLETLCALEKAKGRGQSGRTVGAQVSRPGEVTFTYGASTPTVICSVLNLTDLALESGEVINQVNLGASTRWSISHAVSGTEGNETSHLIIKPGDSGLQTSMIITTDRRTYHITLKSTIGDFMPAVRFNYPGGTRVSLNQAAPRIPLISGGSSSKKARESTESTKVALDKVSFEYEIAGDEDLKPVRVYNDGAKTIIEMPPALMPRRLPALVVTLREGGWFGRDKNALVNYRVKNIRFIVDGLIAKARLILGNDDDARSATITYKG